MIRKATLACLAVLFAVAANAQTSFVTPNALQEPILYPWRSTVFTLHVNTYHPKGFYFVSYYSERITSMGFIDQSRMKVTWSETMGTVKQGDMERTDKEAVIDFAKLTETRALVNRFRPNADHSNNLPYVEIALKTNSTSAITLKVTKYEIDGGSEKQLSFDEGYAYELKLPFSNLDDCTDCKPTIYAERLVASIDRFRKSVTTTQSQSVFDAARFRQQLLSILSAKKASSMMGNVLRTEKSVISNASGTEKEEIINTFYRSSMPLFDLDMVLSGSERFDVYNLKGRYQAGNASDLFEQIEDAVSGLAAFTPSVKEKRSAGRDNSTIIRELHVISTISGKTVAVFSLSDQNHLDLDTYLNLPKN